MKIFSLFTIFMLICFTSYCQPMLGCTRDEILAVIDKNATITFLEENLSPNGTPYIKASVYTDLVAVWFFKDGAVYQYKVILPPDMINDYILFFDDNLFYNGILQWIDYSTGVKTYYYMRKEIKSDNYQVTVSWKELI